MNRCGPQQVSGNRGQRRRDASGDRHSCDHAYISVLCPWIKVTLRVASVEGKPRLFRRIHATARNRMRLRDFPRNRGLNRANFTGCGKSNVTWLATALAQPFSNGFSISLLFWYRETVGYTCVKEIMSILQQIKPPDRQTFCIRDFLNARFSFR